MQVLSIFRRLMSWVVGSSSVLVSLSVTVASPHSCLDSWAQVQRESVPCLHVLASWLWPAVFCVLVINCVLLVCSGTPCFLAACTWFGSRPSCSAFINSCSCLSLSTCAFTQHVFQDLSRVWLSAMAHMSLPDLLRIGQHTPPGGS